MEVELSARVSVGASSKTFELSLTKDYVAHWGLVQAVRELIQNALDSDSPFIYEFFEEEGGTALRLNSEFTVLQPATLLLGMTSKTDNPSAIGSFGEGFKIALLVLTRGGYDTEVLNGDKLWRPRFRHSRQFGAELLVIDESAAEARNNRGLTFVVHGLAPGEVAEIEASCLRMQKDIGRIHQTEFGDILLDRSGKLYVGSLFVCDTELANGYNIKPEFIRLERDRQTVVGYELAELTLKMWLATGRTEEVARMIFEEKPDVADARYGAPQIIKEECYRIFKERNPGKLIAESPEELKKMVKAGLTETIFAGGYVGGLIRGSTGYRSAMPKIAERQSPTGELNLWLAKHKGEMRPKAIKAFNDLIKLSEEWGFK